MSKNCIITTVKSKIKGNATSYIEKENEIFIPISKKFTLNQTRAMAQDKVNKINKEYLSEKFGKVVSLNTSASNGTGIKIHPSQLLIDAYEVKEGNKSIEELNPRNLDYFNGDEALLEQEQREFNFDEKEFNFDRIKLVSYFIDKGYQNINENNFTRIFNDYQKFLFENPQFDIDDFIKLIENNEYSIQSDLNSFIDESKKIADEIKDVEQQVQETTIKPGVSELFRTNPELSKIGTQEQYSQYLDTIFPDSKVKDIVYHGGNIKGDLKIDIAFYTSKSKEYAKEFIALNPNATKLYELLVNVKEPSDISYINYEVIEIINNIKKNKQIDLSRYRDSVLDFAINLIENKELLEQIKESDSFIGKDLYDDSRELNIFSYGNSPEYFYKLKGLAEATDNVIIFEPEQIHILGSKQDIEGFKEFVEQSIVEENVTNNQNTQDKEIEFTPEDLGLNTDSNQNDAVCK